MMKTLVVKKINAIYMKMFYTLISSANKIRIQVIHHTQYNVKNMMIES